MACTALHIVQGLQSPAYSTGPAKLYVYHALCARLYRPYIIRRAVEALHNTQGCTGPAVYAGLCRPCSIHSALKVLHYTQGFAGPAVYVGLYRPNSIHRAVQAMHYMQGCVGPTL